MPAGLGGVLAKRASREVKMEVRTKKFYIYRKRAIITRSWFETALNHKPRILDLKIEELPLLST